MYGAILGDIIGSPYEFDLDNKSERFYGVPEELKHQCRTRLPMPLRQVLQRFDTDLS